MAESVSREMILPAVRLDVPPRPSEKQVAAFAARSSEEWTTTPRTWVTQQVTRLAVAAILRSRLEQAAATPHERNPLPAELDQVTLGQLVAWFRPHVGLAGQAFQLGIVEAVNAGVPAAVDPLREGLRRMGVTGRDPLKMVALGADKVPERARGDFWNGVKTAPALTAVVDALLGSAHTGDVSGLDRSQLARADAVVLGGGRATAVSFGTRPREGKKTWLSVPLRFAPAARGRGHAEPPRRGDGGRGDGEIEVGLRAGGWTEVFETALDAVGAAMAQLDAGGRPRGRGPASALGEALVQRLVAAKDRSVVEVCASLRAVDPLALEMFDHQVTTTAVRVAVPVVEDDAFMQLWLPTSALAGPLFTGSADLFLGEGAEVKAHGGKPTGNQSGKPSGKQSGKTGAKGNQPGGRQGGRSGQQPGQQQPGQQPGQQQTGGREGGRSRRGRGKRPSTSPATGPATGPAPARPPSRQPQASRTRRRPTCGWPSRLPRRPPSPTRPPALRSSHHYMWVPPSTRISVPVM